MLLNQFISGKYVSQVRLLLVFLPVLMGVFLPNLLFAVESDINIFFKSLFSLSDINFICCCYSKSPSYVVFVIWYSTLFEIQSTTFENWWTSPMSLRVTRSKLFLFIDLRKWFVDIYEEVWHHDWHTGGSHDLFKNIIRDFKLMF